MELRLENAEPEAFRLRGVETRVGGGEVVFDVYDVFAHDDPVARGYCVDQMLVLAKRIACEDEQPLRTFTAHRGKGGEQQIDALQWPHVRRMDDQEFVFTDSELAPHIFARTDLFRWNEEVRNDVDRVIQPKSSQRLAAQAFGDRRDCVRFRQRVLNRVAIARILAQQRGVRAVQRGDDLRGARWPAEHLHREVGRGCMRHGVMNVEDVEVMLACDVSHLHRERQCVIRIFEKPVLIHHDLMEKDAGLRHVESHGLGRAEEMNVVPSAREFGAERGRENPASANERITGDADAERSAGSHVRTVARSAASPSAIR